MNFKGLRILLYILVTLLLPTVVKYNLSDFQFFGCMLIIILEDCFELHQLVYPELLVGAQ